MAGNLVNNNGTTRTYNAANQMVDDGTNTLTYDANSNLTNDGVDSYTWDRANRLASIGSTSYGYDGLGNRISQNALQYLLDIQPSLTVVLGDSDGNHYVHGVRGIHAQKDSSSNWEYMMQDGLGSVRGIVDVNNAVIESRAYDPIGNLRSGAVAQSPIGFTGEFNEGDLVYLRARYMKPSLGTFLSRDPFEGMTCTPMSLNGYSWVEGNVPNMVDPSGECFWCVALVLALVLTGCATVPTQTPSEVFTPTQEPFVFTPIPTVVLPSGTPIPITDVPTTAPTLLVTQTPMPPATSTQVPPTPTLVVPFINPVRSGDCSRSDMHASDGTRLQSRDINTVGASGLNPVVSPANNAEVVIVDAAASYLADDTANNNSGLGNFVAIRIPNTSIPQQIIDSNPVMAAPGYLWMGFAHLNSIAVAEGAILNSGASIGVIGNTGLRIAPNDETTKAHLHLTMFYIPIGGQLEYTQYGLSGAQLFNTIGDDSRAYPSGTTLPLSVDANDIWLMSSCR